ncbi:hypothetical protein JCGZ_13035 [Jatropha curcas]|uniref:SKP1-like protein n=1 Tax=Jatropha curcas TaxID=180498 RepID=A0A067KMG6_JATCU|nr:hypothetical protein JCGZ_13035 [Jatropha curcas]
MESKQTITLKTFDNKLFEIEEAVAMEMITVKSFFDEFADNSSSSSKATIIPLPNVSSASLSLIITYIEDYLKLKSNATDLKAYNAEFVKKQAVDIKELILAVNYLNIKYLLDLLSQAIADHINNKSVEYVRGYFGFENDFTPQEEARLREENAWAYEGVDQD